MVIKQKKKGSDFERLAVELLNRFVKSSHWRRIPGSGAIGTSMDEPSLQGDISGRMDALKRTFKAEAKVGYGGATQLTLKKEWLDKIADEARSTNSIPFLIGKFSGSRNGTKVFVTLDLDTFCLLLNTITELHEELENELK